MCSPRGLPATLGQVNHPKQGKGVCSLSLHSKDFPGEVPIVHLRFIVYFSQPASNLVLSLACRMSLVGTVEQLQDMGIIW